MRIIEEGKAPEIIFRCKTCNTKFAEDAKQCSRVTATPNMYWWTICPVCGQMVQKYDYDKED